MAMGFHAPLTTQPPKRRAPLEPSEMLLTFDGGDGITLHEATHNVIALGASGTGKTSSVILPALHALLRAGHPGLVVDIKGNFSKQTRALATQCNREGDLVEFGTGPHVAPINILQGMDNRQVFDFLRMLTVMPFGGRSQSLDWHLKGARQAADCLELLRIFNQHCPEITADFNTLDQLVNDPPLATSMFKHFKKHLQQAENKEHKDLARRVSGDAFHICNHKAGQGSGSSANCAEQVTWRLGAVRDALSLFREAPGVLRNFAAPGASGIDLARLIYTEGKVVVLRFDAAGGGVGALLARHILESFYTATYAHGLLLPEGQRAFFVGDEAQDFVDLNPYNKCNDNVFTAKAREFRVIQVLGTQSVASLGSRGAGAAQVNEYLNNFGSKLLLFNDDPQTLQLAERFDPNFSFQALEQGQCLAIHFDAVKHRPVCTHASLQQAHDATRGLVSICQPEQKIALPESTAPTALEDVFNKARQAASPELQTPVTSMPFSAGKSPRAAQAVAADEVFATLFCMPPDDMAKTSAPSAASSKAQEQTEFQRVVDRYSTIFSASPLKGCELPKGWLSALERGISMVSTMEVSLQIQGFNILEGRLYAIGDGARTGLDMLNTLLAVTRCTCPVCGKYVSGNIPHERDFAADAEEQYGGAFTFCDECLQKAGFTLPVAG